MTIRRAAFLVILLAGPAAAEPKHPDYPKARTLCSEHVTGTNMHILWRSSATSDPIAKVVAHYEKLLKTKAGTDDHGQRTFKDDDHVLSIFPAASADKFPSCSTKPNKRERTVILRSQAVR